MLKTQLLKKFCKIRIFKKSKTRNELYLSEIEYSLQVSQEWHLKKKLAAVLERSKAYNLLTSYKSLEITEGRAVVELTRDIKLTNTDKEIILSQVQATHEKRDKDGVFQLVESLEMKMPEQRSGFVVS